MSEHAALAVACTLLGLWGTINALQWKSAAKAWRSGGPLGWDLQGLRRSRLYSSRALASLFTQRGLNLIVATQLCCAVMLIILPVGSVTPFLLAILGISSALLILRSYADGADKAAMVAIAAALLQSIGALVSEPLFVTAGVIWAGGQLTLAYFTAGAWKIRMRGWRDGTIAASTLSSYEYGSALAHRAMHLPGLAWALSGTLILAEILFPLALFAPQAALASILGGFLLFHIATAWFMGLNTYPLAFAAAYPSTILMSDRLRSLFAL